MTIFPVVLMMLLVTLGVLASYTDIKNGIIPNKNLAVFGISGLVVDLIYYGCFSQGLFVPFLANLIAASLVSVVLFYTHSLAGGDCKLIIVLSILYPAEMYVRYYETSITLFSTVWIALIYGYIYLVGTALFRLLIGKNRFNYAYAKGFVLSYIKSYLTAIIYVTLINSIFIVINKILFRVDTWLIICTSILVAWISGKKEIFKNRIILLCCLICIITISYIEKVVPISINPKSYILTALLMLCQLTIRTNLYETISVDDIRKGMILSAVSSIMMQNSRVKGLPGISTEDLSSRLTYEEAESVVRWGKTAKGVIEIVIVKKIPFAVFILLGYLSYFFVWRIIR